MADRTVTLRIGANVSDAVSKIKTLETTTSQWISKHQAGLNTVTTSLGIFGAGLTAVAGLAVKRFTDFDAAMSSVAAATMETTENIGLLREAAIEAGADTQYSATEAAQGIEELGKAGLSTADILTGGLDGALDLAASGAISGADAAETTASALTQFSLEGSEATHVADLLAAGAGKAQGGVLDMGQALKQSGLVANQFGLSVEETVGTLTAFASAGLVGSDAGTSFRTMLLRLANPTGEAKDAMKELGIAAYDTQGDFVGMASLAGQLDKALKPLPQSQRDAALATIFGQDAIRGANVLYKQGEQGIRDWIDAVDDQGFAAEQARIRTDNLRGDIERLGGSLDSAFIKSGSGANNVLRELTQNAENLVDGFGSLPTPIQEATLMMTGAAGLTTLGAAGLGKLVVGINDVRTALGKMNISAGKASLTVGAIGAALALGTYYLKQWADAAAESKQNTDEFASTLDEATGAVTNSTRAVAAQKVAASEAARIYKTYGGDVTDLTNAVLGSEDAIKRVNAVLAEHPADDGGLFGWMNSSGADQVQDDIERLTGDLAASKEQWDTNREAMEGVEKQTGDTKSAIDRYSDSLETGTNTLQGYSDALAELVSQQRDLAGIVLDERTAQRQYEAALDAVTDSLTENGQTLDITTAAGRANADAVDDVATKTWDLIDAMQANGATQDELQAVMATTRKGFIDSATAAGMGADEANRLADELGLIPENVNIYVDANTDQANAAVDSLLAKIAGAKPTIYPNIGDPRNIGKVTGYAAFATGGEVTGGVPGRDSVLTMAMPGEWYVRKAAVDSVEAAQPGFMSALNRLGAGALHAQRFAQGGPVLPQYVSVPAYAGGGSVGIDYDRLARAVTSQGHTFIFQRAVDPQASAVETARTLAMLEG